MNRYKVEISEDASNDMDELSDTIIYEYSAPNTAFNYIQGILDTINSLRQFPYAYPVRRNISLQRFGHNVRRINYKKWLLFIPSTAM
jgi:plasmid stabilization system protein ParE